MFDFSARLKSVRISKNLTQKKAAAGINTGERNYQRYELNENKPSYEIFLALADFFDVSLDYLAGRTDKPDSHK